MRAREYNEPKGFFGAYPELSGLRLETKRRGKASPPNLPLFGLQCLPGLMTAGNGMVIGHDDDLR